MMEGRTANPAGWIRRKEGVQRWTVEMEPTRPHVGLSTGLEVPKILFIDKGLDPVGMRLQVRP